MYWCFCFPFYVQMLGHWIFTVMWHNRSMALSAMMVECERFIFHNVVAHAIPKYLVVFLRWLFWTPTYYLISCTFGEFGWTTFIQVGVSYGRRRGACILCIHAKPGPGTELFGLALSLQKFIGIHSVLSSRLLSDKISIVSYNLMSKILGDQKQILTGCFECQYEIENFPFFVCHSLSAISIWAAVLVGKESYSSIENCSWTVLFLTFWHGCFLIYYALWKLISIEAKTL